MWSQAYSQSHDGTSSHPGVLPKRSVILMLPCTVSQLLSAPAVGNDTFAIGTVELNQVSVLGVVRGFAPFVAFIQCSVDDMTGPPLTVKQWVNPEGCPENFTPGTYVKVIGSLRLFSGQRALQAMSIRRLKDPNEITSHMLEVVQAHMQLFGKVFDVNMNTAMPSTTGKRHHPVDIQSSIQAQVLKAVKTSSVIHFGGISLHELKTQLDISMEDIRTSLESLMSEGLVFNTIDEQHFKSTDD